MTDEDSDTLCGGDTHAQGAGQTIGADEIAQHVGALSNGDAEEPSEHDGVNHGGSEGHDERPQ